jgi:hypothetical protein
MKKILLLTVCIQLLASCGYACIDTSKLVVITSIESAGANKTIMATVIPVWLIIFGLANCSKWETCGKFQIGDTFYKSKSIQKHFCEYQLEVVNI